VYAIGQKRESDQDEGPERYDEQRWWSVLVAWARVAQLVRQERARAGGGGGGRGVEERETRERRYPGG
jgi:hypothetical protein